MTAIIISKSTNKDKSAGKRPARQSYVPIPQEATQLVREGWEGLDTAVDQIRDEIAFSFVALLEAPLRILEASAQINGKNEKAVRT